MKTILLLGAGTGSRDAVAKFKRLGIKIIMAELRDVFDYEKCQPADEIILTDYALPEFVEFALKLRETWPYDVAVSITEVGAAVAAHINERIGVRGANPRAIRYLTDKASMRELLNQHDFSQVKSKLIKNDADLEGISASAGYPLIIKPFDGGGSHGIHLANNREEARNAVTALREEGLVALAEQFIDGKEYSVESFSFDGDHFIAGITEKIVNDQFIEVGHVVPARLDASLIKEITEFVKQFLSIVGVTNGPGHTEMKVSSSGLKIIESHNRVGGGNIPKLVHLVHGIDLISLTGQWACDQVEPGLPNPASDGAAAVHFFIFPAGEITELEGLQQIADDPSVVDFKCTCAQGDVLPPLTSNSSRVGYVLARGETADQALDKVKSLAASVTVRTK